MTEYTITDLRGDLAETIRALRNGDEKMSVEKAKAIGELAQTMINSAKVEVDMLRAAGNRKLQPTGFVPLTHEGDTLDQQEPGKSAQIEGPSKPRPHVRQAVGTFPRSAL